MQKFHAAIIIFVLFIFFNASVSSAELRKPQGRLGVSYKTERYNPHLKSNISAYDLSRIEQIIEQEEIEQRKAKKEQKERELQEAKLAKQMQKDKLKQERAAVLEEQKRREDEIRAEVNRVKEQQKLAKQAERDKLKQERAAALEEQKRKEDEIRAEENRQKEQIFNEQQAIREQQEQQKLAEQEEKERIKEEVIRQKEQQREEKRLAKLREEDEKLAAKGEIRKKSLKSNFFKKLINSKSGNNVEEVGAGENASEENQNNTIDVSSVKIVKDPITHKIVKEIKDELAVSRPDMLQELSTLWVSAVQKSDTVYFAIMKLSNPNGEEVNKKGIKKILEPIISAAPLVGQAFVNPALSAGSIIGSSLMGTMVNDSAKQRLAKVNDADLVILARAIDELQESLLLNYMAYKSALMEYELTIKIAEERRKSYESLNKINSPHVILANTFYTEALDNQYKARQEFLMKRVVLEQMVGADALNEIEQKKYKDSEEKQNNNESMATEKPDSKSDEKTEANQQINNKADNDKK